MAHIDPTTSPRTDVEANDRAIAALDAAGIDVYLVRTRWVANTQGWVTHVHPVNGTPGAGDPVFAPVLAALRPLFGTVNEPFNGFVNVVWYPQS